jgi:plasmid maintenance system antidote protein VapI
MDNLTKAEKAISEISGQIEAIPWRQVYPDFNTGIALRGARYKENLTQEKLANLVGIRQIHISEMEHNKRTIGKDMAKRFAGVLHVDYRVFL